MAEYTVRCRTCGGPFEASRRDAEYCSPRCRQAALRDRTASDASVVVGGIAAPVESFSCSSGSFGTIGCAEIECSLLRGEPAHDGAGRIPVEVSLSGRRIWAGDLQRGERSHASGAITLKAAGLESRLVLQRWGAGTWEHLTLMQFCSAAAERAGLNWIPPEAPLDSRTLVSIAEADGVSGGGARNALEVLLLASRELGYMLAVRDGALIFGPALPTEPRTIEGRNIRLTSHDATRCEVIARSSLLTLVGGGMQPRWLRTGNLAAVPPGVPVYLAVLPAEQTARAGGRVDGQVAPNRQFELDRLHSRLVAEISAGLLAVEADTDALDLRPYEQVRLEAVGEKLLLVTRTEHRFTAEAGVVTHFEALHLPPAPTLAVSPTRIAPRVVAPWSIAA